jgi:hypothetical protein
MATQYNKPTEKFSTDGLKHTLKSNYVKGAIILALLGGGKLAYNHIKDKYKGDIESVISDGHPFPKQDLQYRDEPQLNPNGKELLKK